MNVYNEVEILSCIDKIRYFLTEQYIVEGCRQHRALGCVSCQAIEIDRALELLASEITDNLHDELTEPTEATRPASFRRGQSYNGTIMLIGLAVVFLYGAVYWCGNLMGVW